MKLVRVILGAMLILEVGLMGVSCGPKVAPVPPVAKIETKTDTLFGQVLTDDYGWLRDKENPEVIQYLEAENAYTEAVLSHTEKFQEELYQEMVGRIKETDMTVPVKRDQYYYYSRTEEGKQYEINCRKMGSPDGEEEILLDGNVLAEGHEYMGLGFYSVSPDHKLLAYGVDYEGNERYTLWIKNLESGEMYPDVIENLAGGLVWANDNETFFYNVPDEAWRPYKLFRHKLGGDPAKDVLVYQEADEAFWVSVGKSKSKQYLFINLGSQTTSEVFFLSADNPTGEFQVIEPRRADVEYHVRHHGKHFYIVTNDDGAKNFKLMKTRVDKPSRKYWREVIEHREKVKLNRVEMFRDFMVLYERENGLKQIWIKNFRTNQAYPISFPEPTYSVYGSWNPEYDGHLLRFHYESFVTPESVYDFNMMTKKRELKKQKEVLGGYDPDLYQSKRIFATARDGVKVPISMMYRKDKIKDKDNLFYLYGYGAYEASMDPYFSSNRLSLVDRGFIYARAHIRGGGEMGRYWYDDGKLLNKKNTFYDFIDCAEYVIKEGYTSKDKLVIYGGSGGGLLIGAVVNMQPELFHVAIADVPFVDLMNTMLDPSIPLTVIEYDEWGNPNVQEYFEYMMSYSPYDNVSAQDYPYMLVLAGLNDTRVQYWEPAKWTAKLRAHKTDNNLLLLKTNMGAGHGGSSGRYDFLREIAVEFAFVLDVFEIRK